MITNHGQIVECAYDKLEKSLSKMPNTHISSKKAEKVRSAWSEFMRSLRG